jgi:hypothetical protein
VLLGDSVSDILSISLFSGWCKKGLPV